MKTKYFIEYKDEDGVNMTSFSLEHERQTFINFHNSEISEKFEVIRTWNKTSFDIIKPLVCDVNSFITILVNEGYNVSKISNKTPYIIANLTIGKLKPNSEFLKCKLNKTIHYVFDDIVISYKGNRPYISYAFCNNNKDIDEDYVIVKLSDSFQVRKDNDSIENICAPSSFSGCMSIIEFIKKNIQF